MKKKTVFANILLAAVILGGCGIAPQANSSPDLFYTAAAQTMAVTLTYGAVQNGVFEQATQNAIELATLNAPTATVLVPSETPTAEITATPESTTPQPSATLMGTVSVTATENTNCRTGPTAYYEYQSAFMAGQVAEVVARDSNTSWYQIVDPEDATLKCWVTDHSTTLNGDLSLVKVVTVAITPIPYYSINGWISPSSYAGACPVTITVYGKIKANTGSYDDISYGWSTNFGVDPGSGTTEFHKAGSQTVSAAFTITADTDGYVKFHMYDPSDLSTGKLKLHVDCD